MSPASATVGQTAASDRLVILCSSMAAAIGPTRRSGVPVAIQLTIENSPPSIACLLATEYRDADRPTGSAASGLIRSVAAGPFSGDVVDALAQ
jgi:hypothetical protein